MDEKLFGTVAGYVRVVEFQERGLSHSHAMFLPDLAWKHRLKCPENVDDLEGTKIPSVLDQQLWELFLKHSILMPLRPLSNPWQFA